MSGDSLLKYPKHTKHVLVLPMCVHSHMAGIFRHSIELAKRGVTVTFVGLERGIALLKTIEEIQELDFNLISYRSSEDEAHPLIFLDVSRRLFQPILDKLVKDKKVGLPGPTCIIGDSILTWVPDVANALNVPYYQFWPTGSIFVRKMQAYPQLFADGILTVKQETGGKSEMAEFDGQVKISGLPALTHGEMATSLDMDLYKARGSSVGKADAVIVNTFYDLESPIIDAIRQSWLNDSGGKIHTLFPVGPIATAATFKDRSFVEDLDNQRHDCLTFLDSRPPRSVVYVCFGSLVQLESAQINELALGIEASEQNFLWVIRQGSEGALPPGFEERTREKGMIISGWAPQLQILTHSSIGGFVTHCGWNSIIESITSGVPMAAWPQLKSDQFSNCRYLVDVLKIAAEVRSEESSSEKTAHSSTNQVKREHLEKVVRLLMSEEGDAMRSKVQDLKKKAEAAVADGGTSEKALNDVVESIPG